MGLSSDISNIIMLFKENNCRKYFIASLSLLINNVLCKSSNRQMTVVIDAGDDYCFFVPNITTGQNFDFDFEVTESSGAEGVNDISVGSSLLSQKTRSCTAWRGRMRDHTRRRRTWTETIRYVWTTECQHSQRRLSHSS